jgi:hypothetical protein
MGGHFDKWTTIERGDEELEINVEFDATPYIPAKTYGLPENCYPAEGGEIEITAVFHNGIALDPPLTEDEEDKIISWLAENMPDDDDGPDPDEWYGARRDDRMTGGAA